MGAFSFDGQVIVVTGAASGIGAGIAEVLAEAGATVVIADINEASARDKAEALVAAGCRAGHVAIDLADEASIVRGCAEVVEKYGTPWGLVNNAGVQDRELLLDGTVEFWDRTLDINTRGPFLMSRELARAMVAGGQGGRIVNVASASVVGGLTKGHAAYASSKDALIGLTRACALELMEHAITANTVLPGGVITPGSAGAQGPKAEGPGCRMPPLGFATPRDIGAAVLFLASPAAGRVTNQSFAVDGAWSLS